MHQFRITLALLLFPLFTQAQDTDRLPYTELNAGVSIIQEALREGYTYAPVMLMPTTSLFHFGRFSVYAEGQLAYARLPSPSQPEAFEAGINVGLRYQRALGKEVLLSAAIGAGPHYITLRTESQAPGFIFSDNFELGASYLPEGRRTGFNLRARFRHISNAGFKYPNLGVDNLFVIAGLRWAL